MPQEHVIRIPFSELFRRSINGKLVTKEPLFINGIHLVKDTPLPRDKLVAGIDFYDKTGWDVAAVKRSDGVFVIRGFFVS